MRNAPGKQRILEVLDDLPDNASIEEAMERLFILAKVERGLAQLDAGQSLDHEEIKRRTGM